MTAPDPAPAAGPAPDAGPGSAPAAATAPPTAERPRRLALLAGIAVIALAADVVSKLVVVDKLADRAPVQVVPHLLDLQLTRNSGAAFGLASGLTIVFTVVAAAVVAAIVASARRLRSRGWAVALGLLLGGALGNLADRMFREPGVLRGHVVDWIHLTHWPIFNLADSVIVVGGLLAVLLSVRGIGLDGSRT